MSIFPTKILLATDGSEDATLAARTAADIANKTGSELYVGYVLPSLVDVLDADRDELLPFGSHTNEIESAILEEAQAFLDQQVDWMRHLVGAVNAVKQAPLETGLPDAKIVDLAEKVVGAGLIVMGSRGRDGVRRALLGSVSDSVVRHAHCPVMVVRGEPIIFPARLLLATDGSEEAELAAKVAADLAARTGSELHVTTVAAEYPLYELPDYTARFEEVLREQRRAAREVLDEQVKRVEESGVAVKEDHLSEGRTEEEIIVLGEKLGADLLVVGSRGLSGVRRVLMGSVSASVVRHAHCPVLVVRK